MSGRADSATTIAAVLIDALARHGLSDVVVSPGSRSAPLALAALDHPALTVHVRVDERTAAFLALGLAHGSRRPSAVVCSSGTATANHHPAVAEAAAAEVPLVVLSADRPPELRATGANQTIDQQGLYGQAVRFFHETGYHGQAYLRSVVAQAVGRAQGVGGPPGPVHLNVPLREPLVETGPQARQEAVAAVAQGSRPIVVGRAAEAAGPVTVPEALMSMRRGLVVAGDGALVGDVEAALTAAADLGLPVLAEPTSGLRTRAPALRCSHWLAGSTAFATAHRPDVVIQVGRPVLSRPVAALVASADHVVTVDPAGRWWDPQRLAGAVVPHDLGRLLTAALEQDIGAEEGWPAAWLDADAAAAAALDEVLDADGPTEPGVARDLAATLPDGAQLVVASSLPVRHLNQTMAPRSGLDVVGNRGASGIDGFVSTAVGAALGRDRTTGTGPTAALAGDLSILHDMTGLVIGDDEPLPSLPIVVLNNDGGGIFDLLPYSRDVDEQAFRRVLATPHGVTLHGLALTVGQAHTDLDDLAELRQVLDDAWSQPGITLVEVRTDTPSETRRHDAIQTAIQAAIQAAIDRPRGS